MGSDGLCLAAVTVGRWWGFLHWHASRRFLPNTWGTVCPTLFLTAGHSLIRQGQGQNTVCTYTDPPSFGLHYLSEVFASCLDGLQSCFCPSLFWQSPHSISISVTGTLTTYQAAPIAWQAAFWVVRIPFRRLDSYQSQRTWTTDNFQPRAKYMCDWVRETGCMWRLLDFGRFPPFVWRIFLFTLAALSPVCFSV